MTKQDARKVTIIEELLANRINNTQAAQLLRLSIRQIQRFKAQATTGGILSILHKSRGHTPVNTLDEETATIIRELYQNSLQGYNFTHATDVLAEEKEIFVSVSTVSRILKAQGIRSPKAKRRPKKHRSRDARLHEGDMAQMDASSFDWLGTGSYLQLHGAIDDATGRVLALHFEKEETFDGYSELIFHMNHDSHLPREFYTDGRTVFAYDSVKKQKLTIAEELAGKREKQPHFARATREVGILLIIAGSAQAKGAIERLWETLQDRLPKDMKRRGITTVEQANAFLTHYIPYYNRKFSVPAASQEKRYLSKQDPEMLQVIFSRQETRKIDSGLAFSYGGKKYRLPSQCNDQRVSPTAHDTIIVAISKYIGIKVLYKGFVLTPELLSTPQRTAMMAQPQKRILPKRVSEGPNIPANSNSPWHIFIDKSKTTNLPAGG
ncbi:MAG: ISNCY family transposase [Spirochaetales bacterium]|nr:ISNCY family transposase [Spirochaetales bacterium]